MALDDFTTEESEQEEPEPDSVGGGGVDGFPTLEGIAKAIEIHARRRRTDMEFEDGKVTADTDDLAMLFAQFFLRYDEADPHKLQEVDLEDLE